MHPLQKCVPYKPASLSCFRAIIISLYLNCSCSRPTMTMSSLDGQMDAPDYTAILDNLYIGK